MNSSLIESKISNPDGVKFEHYISFFAEDGTTAPFLPLSLHEELNSVLYLPTIGVTQIHALPVIFSAQPTYSKKIGKNFFQYLKVAFLVIHKCGNKWVAAAKYGGDHHVEGLSQEESDLQLLATAELPSDFWRQVGGNTFYMHHPDETVADNFVMLVHSDKKVPKSPDTLQRLYLLFGGGAEK